MNEGTEARLAFPHPFFLFALYVPRIFRYTCPTLRRCPRQLEGLMSTAASQKICIVCKQDCSGRLRTKDAQGRYVCQQCVDKVQAKVQAKPAAQPKPVAALSPAKPDITTADEELLDLLTPPPPPKAGDRAFAKMKPGSLGESIGVEGEIFDPNVRHCQKCKAEMPGSGRICTSCGHDPGTIDAKMVPKHLRKVAPAKCQGCGYDMRGAPSDVCPECGKKLRAPKNAALLDMEAEAKRELYRPPIILGIVGWGLTLAILATMGSRAPIYMLVMFVSWLVAIPMGIFAFWICSLFYLEYDAPWHATALRLAGIYAAAQVPSALGYAVGLNAFGFLSFIVLIVLYIQVLELEVSEACMMSFVTRGLWWAVAIGLVIAFA